MLRRRDEFGRTQSRWAQRELFGERRRRRSPWVPLLLVAAVAGAAYGVADPQRRAQIQGLWAEINKPTPAAVPASGDRLSTLPLPPGPAEAR